MRQIEINNGSALKCLDCGSEYAAGSHHVCVDISLLSDKERLQLRSLNYRLELGNVISNLRNKSDGYDSLDTSDQIVEYVNSSNAWLAERYGELHQYKVKAPLPR